MRILKICIICNKKFLYRNAPSDVKAGGGKYCSELCQHKNMSKVLKDRNIKPKIHFQASGRENPAWKDEEVSRDGLHKWMYRYLGKPQKCEHCGTKTAKRFEWANKSHEYLRDLTDWIRLCTSCHRKYDGHSQKAWVTRRLNQL